MRHAHDVTIGGLADKAGCTVATIRYYEEIGLLPRAVRRAGGHRVFGATDLRRLTFIRRCRSVGFPIGQIRQLITLAGSRDLDCAAVRDLGQRRLDEIRGNIRELKARERAVEQFVADCDLHCAGGPASECCVLADIASTASACCGAKQSRTGASAPGHDSYRRGTFKRA